MSDSGVREPPFSVLDRLIASIGLASSLALLGLVVFAFSTRIDAVCLVTTFPAWCWATLGGLLAAASLRGRWRRGTTATLLSWVAFTLIASDSRLAALRALTPSPTDGDLRVVSINCSSNAAALGELDSLDPDIVLLQESPSPEAVSTVAERWFGGAGGSVWSPDCAVVARGDVVEVETPEARRGNFVHARVTLPGRTIEVLSLRLFPNLVRVDAWSPSAWRAYRDNRRKRRRQAERVADYLATLDGRTPLVVGGDFNAPPRDAALDRFAETTADAFRSAGRGWGATILNRLPVVRIDQVRGSPELTPLAAWAEPTRHSDHRRVVADFRFAADAGR